MKPCLRIPGVATLAAALALLTGGTSARSQPNQLKPWDLLVSYDGMPENAKATAIALRPNVVQPVYLFLKNNGQLLKRNIHVKIVGPPQDKPWKLEGFVEKVAGNKHELVKFKAAPLAGDIPFQLKVLVEEGKGNPDEEPAPLLVPVTILRPSDYCESRSDSRPGPEFDDTTRRLTVPVRIKKDNADAADPPCPIALELNRLLIPGLVPPKLGLFKDKLTPKNLVAELSCANLQRADENVPARVAVTVDGFARAFQFQLQPGKLPPLRELTRMRMMVPRYFNPEEKIVVGPKGEEKKEQPVLPVLLQADGLLGGNYRLELAFDRQGNGHYVAQEVSDAAPGETGPGGGGGPSAIHDAGARLEDEPRHGGRSGAALGRLRVLDRDGKPQPIADEQIAEPMTLFTKEYHGKYANLTYVEAEQAVYADIVIDAFGPEDVKLIDLPARAAPGSTVVLKASTSKRTADQAPLEKVLFFVGDPKKEVGIPGVYDRSSLLWTAKVKLPAQAKDKLPVTVEMMTANDMKASAAGSLVIAAAAGGDELSKITGASSRKAAFISATAMWCSRMPRAGN